MASRLRRPPSGHVTIIGHNSQILPTVGFFVGGGHEVRVHSPDDDFERLLAPYPGVKVRPIDKDYAARPDDLPPPPYVVAVDRREHAERIRAWLPPTVACFLVGSEQLRRRPPEGFLPLLPSHGENRANVARRLGLLARVDRLMELGRGARAPLILMYADPDPDAVGAALALASIWKAAGSTPLIRYTGEVQRYQNKLLLGWLKTPIQRLTPEERAAADLVAVVDAQPGFWREDPPAAQVVIDHHPRREDTQAEFTDLREHVGATSTILTEYLVEAGLPIPRQLATALLYGITTDTDELRRNTSSADIRAYEVLHRRADRSFVARLEKSQIPAGMLDAIAWGISHRVVYRDLLIIHFGVIGSADVLVQSADLLLLTYGVAWVVCAGVRIGKDGSRKLTVVFRGDGHRNDVGKRARLAFEKLGSAGGHRSMGRAEVPLGDEPVEATIDLLVDNLFRRMSPRRRTRLIARLRSHLDSPRPADAADFEFTG